MMENDFQKEAIELDDAIGHGRAAVERVLDEIGICRLEEMSRMHISHGSLGRLELAPASQANEETVNIFDNYLYSGSYPYVSSTMKRCDSR